VEPTILGWAVALICYPPFNGLLTKYMPWYANDYVIFFNNALTFIIRIIILLLLGIYLSATFALGTRCSNLTNRGIVSRGPYKFIRHPAYIGKNLAWWITIIPVMSVPAFLSMSMWSIVYHLRSITEERHLMKDPDYQLYAKIVKYRYIPGIY
jgi:protein-S-isoprenylcysteine O-methyltransferase Ste14